MSKVTIVKGELPNVYRIGDPSRSARSWEATVETREDGSRVVEGPDGVTSVFSLAETENDVLYKLARVSSDGEMTTTSLLSDLPERYSLARPFGATLDTYGSRYPGEASESMAPLMTWYVPDRRPETLAIIHVLENLWAGAPTKPAPYVLERVESDDDDLSLDATQFMQHGKRFLSFTASADELLKFVEVIPNTEEHPDYPQRQIDYKRLKRIAEYVMTGGFLLPTIIINFYEDVRVEKMGRNRLKVLIPNDGAKHAYCLDGQHRLFTFDSESNPTILQFGEATFEIPVIAMVNEPRTVWHNQFVVINTEQRPVNKNQLLAMQEHFHTGLSEEAALAVRIAEDLNRRPSSVLFKKIYIRSGDTGTILKLKNVAKLLEGHLGSNGTFRTVAGSGLGDTHLTDLFEGYINALAQIFEEEWESSIHVITKTAGWESLLSVDGVLPVAYRKANRRIDQRKATDEWREILEPLRGLEIHIDGQDLPLDWTSFKFRAYCSGRTNIDRFVKAVRSAYEDAPT
jgi:DGQHR domain-containing protein